MKVHVLIRGDLSGMQLFDVSFYHFGEITGRGNRFTKSWRYQENIPPDIERQNKGELNRMARRSIRRQRFMRKLIE